MKKKITTNQALRSYRAEKANSTPVKPGAQDHIEALRRRAQLAGMSPCGPAAPPLQGVRHVRRPAAVLPTGDVVWDG